MSLKRAKHADSMVKDAVFGFIKAHEKKEVIKAPDIIKYLILSYYLIDDYFDKHDTNTKLKLSGRVAVNLKKWASSYSFGHVVVGKLEVGDPANGIVEYEWTLRATLKTDRIIIALLPTVTLPNKSCSDQWTGLQSTNREVITVVDGDDERMESKDIRIFKDTVRIRLDVVKKELSFDVGDGVFTQTINKRMGFEMRTFKLMVHLYDEGDTVEMIQFRIKHQRNNSNDARKMKTNSNANNQLLSNHDLQSPPTNTSNQH